MRAIQFKEFGASDKLQLAEVEKPSAKAGEVLIKIRATTVNPLDMKIRSGSMQQAMPVTLPFIPGLDVAGVVEAIGENTNRFAVGDEVFATTMSGSYAEYIALNEMIVAKKPSSTNFNEAASLAIPLTTAYSILIEAANLQAGQKVLVHGAAGGVGTILVQMAKSLSAYVIGTASGDGIELLKKLGADETIDYKTQDFSALVNNADVVVDLVGGETQQKAFAIVKKGGILLSTVMPPNVEKAKEFEIHAHFVFSKPSFIKLEYGVKLVESGKIKSQVAKVMPLAQAAAAQDLVAAGGINGKLILEVK